MTEVKQANSENIRELKICASQNFYHLFFQNRDSIYILGCNRSFSTNFFFNRCIYGFIFHRPVSRVDLERDFPIHSQSCEDLVYPWTRQHCHIVLLSMMQRHIRSNPVAMVCRSSQTPSATLQKTNWNIVINRNLCCIRTIYIENGELLLLCLIQYNFINLTDGP